MKKTFRIGIAKTDFCFINVEANNKKQALKKIEELINNEEIVNYLDVNSTEYDIEEEMIKEI